MISSEQQFFIQDRNTQVGNICVQWAHLEYLLALAIWSLLRLDQETGKIVTGGLDIRPRLNMAINLAKHLKAPEPAKKALLCTRRALDGGLDERRNKAIHGHRLLDPDDIQSELVEVHRGKGDRKRHKVTNADLAELGVAIAKVAADLHEAMLKTNVYHAACDRPAQIMA